MVANPELLALTPLSPTQIQISAKKPGVTQVNLWDEKQQIYTIDVVITGDARELTSVLSAEFPSSTIKVRPVASGVLISGTVDRPDDVDRIKELAEEYYPKVINHLTVAGVQQVLLHVKVYEVSRTKLRQLGFDWAQISGASFVTSAISESITGVAAGAVAPSTAAGTLAFQAVNHSSSFFGVLDALQRNDLAKILSEPTLTTVSGRPAYFNVGGQIPYSVSQGLGAVSIEWKDYGTRLDFVPFVLGNGRIRLEVRPHVSEVDNSRSLVNGVPAMKVREEDTARSSRADKRWPSAAWCRRGVESQKQGIPLVCDVPYIGALFRRVKEEANEVETLILVSPEIVEGLDPHEVPPCPPGTNSLPPSDCQLYFQGKLEVPSCRCPVPPCPGDGSAEVSDAEVREHRRGQARPPRPGLRTRPPRRLRWPDRQPFPKPRAGPAATILPLFRVGRRPTAGRAKRLRYRGSSGRLDTTWEISSHAWPTGYGVVDKETSRPPSCADAVTGMSNVLRLAIVDPNDPSRESLKSMLLGMEMIWLEAECSRYEFFADVVAQTNPDVGIICLDHDPAKGLELVAKIGETSPDCAMLVVSSSTDGNLILQAMRSGAKEFLTLPIPMEDLAGAVGRISERRFGKGSGGPGSAR